MKVGDIVKCVSLGGENKYRIREINSFGSLTIVPLGSEYIAEVSTYCNNGCYRTINPSSVELVEESDWPPLPDESNIDRVMSKVMSKKRHERSVEVVGRSHFGSIDKDHFLHPIDAGACHAGVKYMKDVDIFYSCLLEATIHSTTNDLDDGAAEMDPELIRRYVQFITDKKLSPWRFMFQHEDRIINGINIDSLDFRCEYGFIFTDLSMPSNMLVNFLIATRAVRERPFGLKAWDEMVLSRGMHPAVAFFFAQCCRWTEDGKPVLRVSDAGHDNPDVTTCSAETAGNFIKGVVVNPLGPYSHNSHYTPCNSIWGSGGKKRYLTTLCELNKENMPTTTKNVWGNLVTHYTPTRELWFDIAAKEEKVLLAA